MVTKHGIPAGQSYGSYLMNQGSQYKQKRREAQLKQQEEDKEMKECTFQPRTASGQRIREGN